MVSLNTSSLNAEHQQYQQQPPSKSFTDALSYLDQIKYTCNEVYKEFLNVMKDFQENKISLQDTLAKINQLLESHPELIDIFNEFLPPSFCSQIEQSQAASILQMMSTGNHHPYTMSNNENNMNVNSSSELLPSFNSSQHVRSSHVQNKQAPVDQAPSRVQDNALSNTGTSYDLSVELSCAVKYINKVEERFQGQPDKYSQFLSLVNTYKQVFKDNAGASSYGIDTVDGLSDSKLAEAEVYFQVAKFFGEHDDLFDEFHQFLPDGAYIPNDLKCIVPPSYQDALLLLPDHEMEMQVNEQRTSAYTRFIINL